MGVHVEVRASQTTFLLGPKKRITLILGKFPEVSSRKMSNYRIIKSAHLKKHSGWTTGHTFKPYELHGCGTSSFEDEQLSPEYEFRSHSNRHSA